MEKIDIICIILAILFAIIFPLVMHIIESNQPPAPHIEYVTEDGKTETIYIPEGLSFRGEWELQNNRDGWRLIFGLEEK